MTALGKIVLAHLPQTEVDSIIEQYGLPQQTEHTISDDCALFDEFQTIRKNGVAFNDRELMLRIRCVAAPVRTDEGGPISLAAPEFRILEQKLREEAPNLVKV